MKTTMAVGDKGPRRRPDDVDRAVGYRIRHRRTMLGISQEKLAEALGITFQQVQKYERGVNRVSAGRLYQLATVLDVTLEYFFQDLPPTDAATAARVTVDPVVQWLRLAARLSRLSSRDQGIIMTLVNGMSRREEPAPVVVEEDVKAERAEAVLRELNRRTSNNFLLHDLKAWIEGYTRDPEYANVHIAVQEIVPPNYLADARSAGKHFLVLEEYLGLRPPDAVVLGDRAAPVFQDQEQVARAMRTV